MERKERQLQAPSLLWLVSLYECIMMESDPIGILSSVVPMDEILMRSKSFVIPHPADRCSMSAISFQDTAHTGTRIEHRFQTTKTSYIIARV